MDSTRKCKNCRKGVLEPTLAVPKSAQLFPDTTGARCSTNQGGPVCILWGLQERLKEIALFRDKASFSPKNKITDKSRIFFSASYVFG
jgi:hypothetical protein